MLLKLVSIAVLYWILPSFQAQSDIYDVGIGIADATGPIADVTFMGYASLTQIGTGLHTRTFSRAFIFEKDDNRVVYVWSDLFSIGPIVKKGVIDNLQSLYGDTYDEHNVILAGSHTHSTPGGFLGHLMFDITGRGYVNQTARAYIDGVTRSIVRAHENMAPSFLQYAETRVFDASVNRSPTSYLVNPVQERAQYDGNIETLLQQLRVVDSNTNALRGLVNWYAVHPTSMNMTNTLVSSDNLGYAALKLEKHLNGGAHPGTGKIVAAFAQSAQGDTSPNTSGARCERTGTVCDNHYLLCESILDKCFAVGPGEDMFESTKIIGNYLFEGALRALEEEAMNTSGSVEIRQQYVNMEEATGFKYDPISKTFDETNAVSGCTVAMGYSFAAGTTDGAGLLNFTQGELEENPLLVYIRDFLGEPTEEDKACHLPKPILLATGRSKFPYPWHPSTVSIAMGRIGNILLASVPSEFTTQSGRRTRAMLEAIAQEYAQEDMKAVLTGFSDHYSHYVTTYEEYQEQRYEAASTLYGPHTLDIYLTRLARLLRSIFEDTEVDHGEPEEWFFDGLISLTLPVLIDRTSNRTEFGDCLQEPLESYHIGETVVAEFVSGHPRNNLRQEESFANVERLENGNWVVVATDADWETKFIWERISVLFGTSKASIEWEIPEGTPSGVYRLHHYGDANWLLANIQPYEGLTREFYVYGVEEEDQEDYEFEDQIEDPEIEEGDIAEPVLSGANSFLASIIVSTISYSVVCLL